MADSKISGLAALADQLELSDLLATVDVSDTTMAASGTDKKITATNALLTGWIAVNQTWTYASASTISVPTDATTLFQKGNKIRLKQGGAYKYFVVTAVAATLLTVYGGSDAVVSAGITDIYVAIQTNPFGFPSAFTWTPAPANLTVGNGTLTGRAVVVGSLVYAHWEFILGNSSAIAGDVTFAPPITIGTYGLFLHGMGLCRLKAGGAVSQGQTQMVSTTSIRLAAMKTDATYLTAAALSSTVPGTWTTNDEIEANAVYEF